MFVFIARRHFDGRVYNVVTENATVRDVVERIRQVVPAIRSIRRRDHHEPAVLRTFQMRGCGTSDSADGRA